MVLVYEWHEETCVGWAFRSWGENDALVFFHIYLHHFGVVIAEDFYIAMQLHEVVYEIVGEGIIIVYDEYQNISELFMK